MRSPIRKEPSKKSDQKPVLNEHFLQKELEYGGQEAKEDQVTLFLGPVKGHPKAPSPELNRAETDAREQKIPVSGRKAAGRCKGAKVQSAKAPEQKPQVLALGTADPQFPLHASAAKQRSSPYFSNLGPLQMMPSDTRPSDARFGFYVLPIRPQPARQAPDTFPSNKGPQKHPTFPPSTLSSISSLHNLILKSFRNKIESVFISTNDWFF